MIRKIIAGFSIAVTSVILTACFKTPFDDLVEPLNCNWCEYDPANNAHVR